MFIYHFNRLIHNKIVWGTFAFIIALMFGLSFGSSASLSGCQATPPAGKLNGKNITHFQISEAESAIRNFERQYAADEPLSSDMVFTQALTRIAIEQFADRIGFTTTQGEIRNQIRQTPIFQANGVFVDMRTYANILARSLRMSPEQYEKLVGQDIANVKINALISSASWVSPAEIEDQLANYTDRLTVQYAILADEFANADITPSDEEVREFYDSNPSIFTLPDQVAVEYVAIPFTNYIPFVTVTEDDLLEYYENNLDSAYTRIENDGTNDVPVQIAIEEVRDEIQAILEKSIARDAAETNAVLTLIGMATAAGGLLPVAEHFGLGISKSPLFGSQGPAGIENAAGFAKTVEEETDVFSAGTSFGMFMGFNYLYIFTPVTNLPSHLQDFDEVSARALDLATQRAKREAFLKQQEACHDYIQTALDEGKTFTEAALAGGLTATTNTTFVIREMGYYSEHLPIAYTAMTLSKNQLSKAAPMNQGSAFVYMVDRETGDAMSAEYERGGLYKQMTQAQANLVNSQWRNTLTQSLRFVPARASQYADQPPAVE